MPLSHQPLSVASGVPFSFDDFRTAWEAQSMTVTLGTPSAGFEGFATPAFDARLSRGGDSLDLSILVYADRQAIGEDWLLTVGKSPVPKEGRVLPDHISIWWNENVAVVVRATAGDMASDALDAFLSLGGPITVGEPKVVFIRQLESRYPLKGVLWMANLDGSEQEQLTPDGIEATFAGLVLERTTGNLMFYYASSDSETTQTLWSLNIDSGERSTVATFERDRASAAVSPDGRYAAYVDPTGIGLLDLRTGKSLPILAGGNLDACRAGTISECVGYFSLAWSPDGRLLLVGKGFWEGATAVAVDPFQEPASEFVDSFLGDTLPAIGIWSPTSDAFCGFGQYAAPSGLYVASAPDWKPQNLLPEYEIYDARDPRYVGRLFTRSLIGVPGSQFVVTQFLHDPDPGQASQPVRVDVSTGALQPILHAGDWVVAVVQPTVK